MSTDEREAALQALDEAYAKLRALVSSTHTTNEAPVDRAVDAVRRAALAVLEENWRLAAESRS